MKNANYLKDKLDVILPDGMASHVPISCLQTFVGKRLESKPGENECISVTKKVTRSSDSYLYLAQ